MASLSSKGLLRSGSRLASLMEAMMLMDTSNAAWLGNFCEDSPVLQNSSAVTKMLT